MNPKEKAKEIYGKFFITTPQPYLIDDVKEGEFKGLKFNDWDSNWTHDMAKKQALISIDLLLNEVDWYALPDMKTEYWEEVKTEISNI